MTRDEGSDRWDQIDRSLDGALSSGEHEVEMVMRRAMSELRDRLQEVHRGSQTVSGTEWAASVTDLDRGIAELRSELARVVERPDDGPTIDDVLYARRTQFEIEGWALHYAALEPAGPPSELVPACHSELASFRAACATGRPAQRDNVDATVARLRTAVEQADPVRNSG